MRRADAGQSPLMLPPGHFPWLRLFNCKTLLTLFKAKTINLFWGREGFSRPFPYFFPLPFLLFPYIFLCLEVTAQIQLREMRSAVSSPAWDKICSHRTRSPGSKYTNNAHGAESRSQTHFCVFIAQRTCLVAAKCRPISGK